MYTCALCDYLEEQMANLLCYSHCSTSKWGCQATMLAPSTHLASLRNVNCHVLVDYSAPGSLPGFVSTLVLQNPALPKFSTEHLQWQHIPHTALCTGSCISKIAARVLQAGGKKNKRIAKCCCPLTRSPLMGCKKH
jgi:hypothetical protein